MYEFLLMLNSDINLNNSFIKFNAKGAGVGAGTPQLYFPPETPRLAGGFV